MLYLGVSYNRPKLDPYAVWNPNAIIFANSSIVGTKPRGLFINTNNSIYIVDQVNKRIQLFFNDTMKSSKTIYGNISRPMCIFVTDNDDIYVSDYNASNRVDKWSLNTNITIAVMYVNSSCYGLFVDNNNTIYCSLYNEHRVVKKWLGDNGSAVIIVAGNGTNGSALNELYRPSGIFVTVNFDLYVADYGNSRIQLFRFGQQNGTTVAGNSSFTPTIKLKNPNAVILDSDGYLFITDANNHRIIGQAPHGFRCIVGCSGTSGSSTDQLSYPWNLAFDSYGNLYVSEWSTDRILKYVLLNNTRVKPYNQPKLFTNSTWKLNATIFANKSTVGLEPYSIFIDKNNAIYIGDRQNDRILIWFNDSINPTETITNDVDHPDTVCIANNGDIYFDNGNSHPRIEKSIISTNISVSYTSITSSCYGLFIDRSDMLYCSMYANHVVYKTWLLDNTTMLTAIAGNGSNGSNSNQFNSPYGIFLDINFNLYVADSGNNRIQFFRLGQSNGITVAGNTSLNITVELNNPIGIVLDADNYLFIVDSNNHRIVRDGPNGFGCLVGCSSVNGSASNQLSNPRGIAFDVYGNLYVVDTGNNRVQRFAIIVDLSETTTVTVPITTTQDIVVNLIQLGTTIITNGYEQDLLLNPGAFSVDLDGFVFNASEWTYKYYCRIYGLSMYPNVNGSLIPIDNSTIDPSNPSCLSNQRGWKYGNSINSSLTIRSHSLPSNQTYEFLVQMKYLHDPSKQVTGSVLVKVQDMHSSIIAIGCVISPMCISNVEYQLVNPTTQVALYSFCIENCSTVQNIQWRIYYGQRNASSNVTEWILFNKTNIYANIWFFGLNTTNLTSTNDLFSSYRQWLLWRFEVVYHFQSETSSSSLSFLINQPPTNGSCSISPLNGTTSTLFDLNCLNWFDNDGIKDYSLYIWTIDQSKQTIIAYSSLSTFQVRFPCDDDPTYAVHLIMKIRDEFDCLTEYNFTSSISVRADLNEMNKFINDIQNTSNEIINNPYVRLLASQNQNVVGQVISLFSNQLNQFNQQNIDKAISNGIPWTSISVSSLQSSSSQISTTALNMSALDEYEKEVNCHAQVREYLIQFISNLAITTSNSLKLQSSALVQLTKATNQLTRNTLTIALNRCYELSKRLYLMSTQISSEDTQIIASQLGECTTNLVTGVNGPLQERMNVLDVDFIRATSFPQDYDTDLESSWSNLNLFGDGNDFSWSTIEKNRNVYYQKQLANEIVSKTKEIISLMTLSLNVHLNREQSLVLNTSEVLMSLERTSFESLVNKQIGNAQINLPSTIQTEFNTNQTISIRSMMEPLASYGNSQSHTNLSRSVSLTILDENGQEIGIRTDENHSIEIIIPRDPNVVIPSMILYNVTSNNSTDHYQHFFSLHYINITTTLPISVHFEVHPLNVNISYLFIYKFDGIPRLNSSVNEIDGWTLLCSFDLSNESIYRYFVNNQQTLGHSSLVIGLREVNSDVECLNSSLKSKLPLINERYNFSSNYEMRVYTSGCYYLDEMNEWKSDGLIVGSLTNHYQTQCFSRHLTTFASGFHVLSHSTHWNYVSINDDEKETRKISLSTLIILMTEHLFNEGFIKQLSILVISLMIYLMLKENKYWSMINLRMIIYFLERFEKFN
ncbi:hypothetical protein I4U23_004038 [Adineta vaga]|nr:hypothetical protein I4U23_004038 [Adineta vaga]